MSDDKRTEHPEDSESDPAEGSGAGGDGEGDQSDWSDEGGATPAGPATDTED